jgi:seryl-tRNA synthetase
VVTTRTGDRMTMYYTEVDGAEPTVSTQVGGIKYTFTNESLTKLIEEKEQLKVELAQLERKFRSARFDVREFFQSRYETDSDEIVCEVDDVNNLLINLETEALTRSWSATVTITATVTGIEASNKDEAENIIKDNIEVNMTTDGDIWVDDISMDSAYPEA